jgi:NTE family protein
MRHPLAALLLMASTAFLAACAGGVPPATNPPTATAGEAPAVSANLERALVLGGGGPVGVAWETGMLKGLRDAGGDVSQADLVVGTSAGAIVGAQIRSGKALDSMYDALLATASGPAAPSGTDPGFDPAYAAQAQQPIRRALGTAPEVTPTLRIEVGQKALAATKVIPEDGWIRSITMSYLAGIHTWPSQPLKIAAGDVTDGTIRFFDGSQGVSIERAVAASSALPGQRAPVTIGDRRYMDGFVGGDNIDGAAGAAILLILAPGSTTEAPGVFAKAQIDQARSLGSRVLYIAPDPEARAAMGTNNADLTKRAPAVQAGARQSAKVAADVKTFWTGSASP